MSWTAERLEEVIKNHFSDTRIIVVANREPFIHCFDGDAIVCKNPASGLTTALDPVMRACGGVWVAHGSGDADKLSADENGRLQVPPEDPSYTLRRVWLTRQEEQGYYYGFANSALWPLCHNAYARPIFDRRDWDEYIRVNQKFAEAVVEEAGDQSALIFVQDYHFALLPRMLKNVRPDFTIAHFWHIPWPCGENFRICPWKNEILDGLLGNDLMAFHIRYHCNNFLETIDRTLEARIDYENFTVTRGGHTTCVQPHPISVDPFVGESISPEKLAQAEKQFRRKHRLGQRKLIVGVDRVDYIKGIPERFRAVDRLLELHPEWRNKFCLLQIGAPSRTHLPNYRLLTEEVESLADQINWKHGDESWRPIVFLNEHHGRDDIYLLYRMATACVVSSLHDGMNLVAKEFVAARSDLRGSLILSQFTGAARELTTALRVNPWNLDETAEAIHLSLSMSSEEQEQRMRPMFQHVRRNSIYRWAGKLLLEANRMMDRPEFELPDEPKSDIFRFAETVR